MKHLPASVVVTNSLFEFDGGSITLDFMDASTGTSRSVCLKQHRLPRGSPEVGFPPGALILDNEVLPVRGPAERALIQALRTARIEPRLPDCPIDCIDGENGILIGADIEDYVARVAEGPASVIGSLLEQLVEFVDSDEYVAVARRSGRAV